MKDQNWSIELLHPNLFALTSLFLGLAQGLGQRSRRSLLDVEPAVLCRQGLLPMTNQEMCEN